MNPLRPEPRGFKSHPRRFQLHPLCRFPIYPTNRTHHPQRNHQLRIMDAKARLQTLHRQILHPSPEIRSQKNQPPTTRISQILPSLSRDKRIPQSETNGRPRKILRLQTHPLRQTELQTNRKTTLHPPRGRSRPVNFQLRQKSRHNPSTNQGDRNASRRSMEPQMD